MSNRWAFIVHDDEGENLLIVMKDHEHDPARRFLCVIKTTEASLAACLGYERPLPPRYESVCAFEDDDAPKGVIFGNDGNPSHMCFRFADTGETMIFPFEYVPYYNER